MTIFFKGVLSALLLFFNGVSIVKSIFPHSVSSVSHMIVPISSADLSSFVGTNIDPDDGTHNKQHPAKYPSADVCVFLCKQVQPYKG